MDPNLINTSHFGSVDPDEEFICPYDPIHKVIAKRFPYHVMKCRKNWNGRTMLTCIFNARHIVPASEHKYHIINCPDKAHIEADISWEQRKRGMHEGGGNYTKGFTDLPTYDRIPSPTEDWDEETSAEPRMGYNPADFPGQAVFQNLTGYSAGQKREYHQNIGAVHFKNQQDVDAHIASRPCRPMNPDNQPSYRTEFGANNGVNGPANGANGPANGANGPANGANGNAWRVNDRGDVGTASGANSLVSGANGLASGANGPSALSSCVQPESTASVKDEPRVMAARPPPGFAAPPNQPITSTVGPPPGFAGNNQLRRPNQPGRAGALQSMPSKRGGRIAANIFRNEDQQIANTMQQSPANPQSLLGNPQQSLGNTQQSLGNPQQSLGNTQQSLGNPQQSLGNTQQSLGNPQQSLGNPQQVATPGANAELGAWQRPLSFQPQRPAGIGRGLVPSGTMGLGRGMVPGIGRGMSRSDGN